MNYRPLLCLAFVALLLTSCGGGGERAAMLDRADSLSYVRPDSALSLLDSLRPEKDKWQESQRMHFELLYVKALDKADQPLPADSVMRQIVAYYEADGDKKLLPLAYYYAARSCRTHGDAPQALDYLQKAGRLNNDTCSHLFTVIHAQMGYLFSHQKLYRKAIEAIKVAYISDSINRDSTGLVYDMRDLSTNYWNYGNRDSSVYYMTKAMQFASQNQNPRMIAEMDIQLAKLYQEQGHYDDAMYYLRRGIAYNDSSNQMAICSIAADLYSKLSQPDTALYYFHRLTLMNNIYAKAHGYRGLSDIAFEKGKPESAYNYFRQYRHYSDSIDKITATSTIAQMNSLYNYQLREEEIERLEKDKEEKARMQQNIYTIFIILALLSISAYFYFRHKNLRLHIRLVKRAEFLEAMSDRGDEQLKRDAKMKQLAESAVAQRIGKILNDPTNINKNLSDLDWKELETTIETLFPHFRDRIEMVCKLSQQKYRICLLTKLDLQEVAIAQLTQRTKQAIDMAAKRLYKEAFDEEGGAIGWKNFILSL